MTRSKSGTFTADGNKDAVQDVRVTQYTHGYSHRECTFTWSVLGTITGAWSRVVRLDLCFTNSREQQQHPRVLNCTSPRRALQHKPEFIHFPKLRNIFTTFSQRMKSSGRLMQHKHAGPSSLYWSLKENVLSVHTKVSSFSAQQHFSTIRNESLLQQLVS